LPVPTNRRKTNTAAARCQNRNLCKHGFFPQKIFSRVLVAFCWIDRPGRIFGCRIIILQLLLLL
jgi:hypothetical protein